MLTKKTVILFSLASVIITTFLFRDFLALLPAAASQEQSLPSVEHDLFSQGGGGSSTERLPGLQKRVTVVRDKHGVPHITASNDHDVYFMMGYHHAQDRFFEMDAARRQGSGTFAELLGPGADDQLLGGDTVSRVFGIKRAAERSLRAYSPEATALIQAYSDGVNAWLDRNSLPPEYATLEITRVPRWTPLDSITIVKLIEFRSSLDFTDLDKTVTLDAYLQAGDANGFRGDRLFGFDIFTILPFEPVATVPIPAEMASLSSQEIQAESLQSQVIEQARQAQEAVNPEIMKAVREFLKRSDQIPLLNRRESGKGSNWWMVAGSKTNTGNAMLANDPHLGLGVPAPFYEIHLEVDSNSSPMNVYGVSFAGVPGVVLGQNKYISWGATASSLDVTDFYFEELVTDNGAPVATRYKGQIERMVLFPEEYRINQTGNGVADDVIVVSPGGRPSGLIVPAASSIVPRRNNGPLVVVGEVDGVSLQYTGASATHDLEGIFALARAKNLDDFKRGIQLIEGMTQNWGYADVNGNIATFVGGKVPLREDIEEGFIDGGAPFFIRNGTGAFRNEWIPKGNGETGFGYEALPFENMPQAVNPAQGFLVNANNDPIGTTFDGIPFERRPNGSRFYLSDRFSAGLRAAKITNLLEQQLERGQGCGKVSFQDMQRIQSNVQMFDAEVFTPYIFHAFDAARGPGAPEALAAFANDPAVREAVGRLSRWDFSAPTGISKGYDSRDINGVRQQPSNSEVSDSVAATIYTVWRSQILANTIVATLERAGVGRLQPGSERLLVNLRFQLDNFSIFQGRGASGLDFFEIPGIDAPPDVRRDVIILKSLKDALNLLAGDAFADAFGGSRNQNDYRWGKLHRIFFSHAFFPLFPEFSIPTAANFEHLAPTLPGLAVDGGFETIDTGPFDVRAASAQDYMFFLGAARRYVGELRRDGIKSVQILPGGESGVPGSRFYANQLSLWLTNDYHRVLTTDAEINSNRFSEVIYKPMN